MVTVFNRPSGKSTSRIFQAVGTRTMRPSIRTRPPCGRFSSDVLAVPGLKPPDELNANVSRVAVGKAAANEAARQSLGTTSNPTAGITATPARFVVACGRASMTSISPVMSRYVARAFRQASIIGRAVAEKGPAQCNIAASPSGAWPRSDQARTHDADNRVVWPTPTAAPPNARLTWETCRARLPRRSIARCSRSRRKSSNRLNRSWPMPP